jgi:hypothetical protein
MPELIPTVQQVARAYHRLGLNARDRIRDAAPDLRAALDELMELPIWQIDPEQTVEAPHGLLRRLPSNAPELLDAALAVGPGPEGVAEVLKLVDSWTVPQLDVSYLPADEPIPFSPVDPWATPPPDSEAPEPTVRFSDLYALLDSSGVVAPTSIDDPFTPSADLPAHILAWLSDLIGTLRGYRITHEQDMLAVGMGK